MADETLLTSSLRSENQASPAERVRLMAFVTDAASEAALREGLADVSSEGIVMRRMTCRQAIAFLRKTPTPRALIVDISGEEQPVSALVDLSDVVEPDVRVLVIGEREDLNFYRQVTRGLGVIEYLYKPLVRSMVARHFGALLQDQAQEAEVVHGGRIISVTGAAGGVGATTVATSLGWHFAADIRRHTLVLDPNLHDGTAALLLGARSGNGLRTALELPQRVDELFVERSAQPVTDRLHVLSGEEKFTEQPAVAPHAAQQLLNVLRRRYNFVIVDVPFRGQQLNRDFIDLSHQRVIVLDPTLPSVRDTLRLLALPNGHMQSRRAILVLNRLGQPSGLTQKQVEETIERTVDVVIPYLPRVVGQAMTLGKPAVTVKGGFRHGILQLAREAAFVSAVESSHAGATAAGRGWRSFMRRRP